MRPFAQATPIPDRQAGAGASASITGTSITRTSGFNGSLQWFAPTRVLLRGNRGSGSSRRGCCFVALAAVDHGLIHDDRCE